MCKMIHEGSRNERGRTKQRVTTVDSGWTLSGSKKSKRTFFEFLSLTQESFADLPGFPR